MSRGKRLIGLVAACGMGLAGSILAAPRADGSSRTARQSEASRLVTGEAVHLQSVVDGDVARGGVAGGSYYIRMEPVQPLDGSSYGANCSIAGNTITCLHGPQRLWFDIYMGGWAPDNLKVYQIGMSYAVLASGAGAPLLLPTVACSGDAECEAVLGPGCQCRNAVGTECQFAFQDKTRPVSPFGPSDLSWAATANTDPIRWGATGFGTVYADPGTDVYAGSLVLDAQPGSFGTYILEFLKDGNTFFTLQDGTSPHLDLFTFTPAIVELPLTHCCILPSDNCTNVTTQGECDALGGTFIDDDDGDLCTIGVCNEDGGCGNFIAFNAANECCNGDTRAIAVIDDDNECTQDACDGSGAVGDRDASTAGIPNHLPVAAGTSCDDGDRDACTAGVCNIGGQCEPTLTFDAARECCNGYTNQRTQLDDGNECTVDTCDGSGIIGDRDPATAGRAIHTPEPAGTWCDNGDGDLCTTGACNDYGFCGGSMLTFDPITECCDGDTGDVTQLDDGDACTEDACDGSGTVGERDAATAGTAVHEPLPPIPADLDEDCAVNLVDYGLMVGCLMGPDAGIPTLICPSDLRAAADLDDDNDIDLADAADLFTLLTSP